MEKMKSSSWKNLLFILIALPLIFISCEKQKQDSPIPEYKYKGDKKAATLVKGGNEFGLELFRLIAQDEETPDNMMMSPVSVAMALGMTYNGAAGETKTAFEETLRLQGFSREEINDIHQALVVYLLQADPKVVFNIANSIWYRHNFNVLDSFIDVNSKYYFAEVSGLDFNNPAAVETINNWIAAKTQNKIEEVLDQIPAEAVMYLINALYFNGMWKFEFDKKNSFDGSFYGENGEIFPVNYMKNESAYDYFENDLLSAIELPYGNGNFVMNVFLPKPGKKINDILEELNANNWHAWMESFTPQDDILVQLPKFKYEFKTSLNDPLKDMGLSNAFTEGVADFSGINPDVDLFISRVIHKTFIDVNEKGTEAAAVTVVEIGVTSAGPEKPSFIADRPFIYAITEKTTGAILFMGKVENPVYE